ncbi:MAG: serine/threonine-protein phosphatase [Anaerolineae bacterium]|nr:serine/threonine-protein phosphatase [Anaerolineae bacterium]
MNLSIGLKTDRGPREGQNQDSILGLLFEGSPQTALLAVADGMGGAKAGELASREAIAVIHEHLVDRGIPEPGDVPERLLQAITTANTTIYEKSMLSPDMEGMGCTIVVALVIDDVYWIASVGDSRAYLMRGQESYQITDDHTWVNARVKEGLLTPEQASTHSLRHVLDRALGAEETIEVDIWPDDILEEGDVLLLCTDGLYGVLDNSMIRNIMLGKSAPEAADALIAQALGMPARDNVSVVVLCTD